MRDKHRIEPFLAAVAELWERFPDCRFGQLMSNLEAAWLSENKLAYDWFYVEDDELLSTIKEILEETQK